MKIEYYAFVMGIVVGVMAGFLFGIIYAVHTAVAANYTYNMTQEEIEEGRLLAFCIAEHKMKLTDIEEFCMTLYGGIDTPYGEAIK